MSSKLITAQLYTLAEVVGGGTPSTKEVSYWKGDIPWITPRDLASHKYVLIGFGERNITHKAVELSNAKLLPKGTVIFSSRAPIGYVAIASNTLTTNQGCKGIICNEEKIHNHFLYYWLKNNVDQIESVASGSTFKEISTSGMRNLELKIPENISEQKEIAKILGDLDRKIEVNRRLKVTLEQISLALFKKYFVDNPESSNWATKPLDEIADFKNGLACQKYPAKQGEQKLRVIKIKEMSSGFTDGSDTVGQGFPQDYIIENGDVLFAWSGTLMTKIWTEGPGALNQHIFKVTSQAYPKWFYHHWVNEHMERFVMIAKSKAVTMGHIKRSHLSEAIVKIPPNEYLERFDEALSALLDKQIGIAIESNSLAVLRDSLLPKLMSGEVNF